MFLDLNMPDIGGYEVLEFVRGQDTLRDVPIVVVTTRGDEGSRVRALAAGATRFLTKPFEPAATSSPRFALFCTRIGERRRMTSLDRQEFVAGFLVEPRARAGGQANLMAVETGLHNNEAHPRAVRELFRALHTLKGLSAMVGVDAVVDIAHDGDRLAPGRSRQRRLSLSAVEVLLQGFRPS